MYIVVIKNIYTVHGAILFTLIVLLIASAITVINYMPTDITITSLHNMSMGACRGGGQE